MELIKVSPMVLNGADVNSANARDIHSRLEVKKDFSDWFKQQVDRLGLVENKHYLKLPLKGETKIEYIVDLDTAKNICLVSFTTKGQEVRDYFIQCEKDLNKPISFEEMAKQTILLADKRIKELELKIAEDRPLVSFAKSIEASVDSVLIANYAKLLSDTENVIIGQNKLFSWLRYAGYLMDGGDRHNVPYQKYIDNGYFEVSTSTFASSTGTHQRFTSKITGKGQIALARKIVEAFK